MLIVFFILLSLSVVIVEFLRKKTFKADFLTAFNIFFLIGYVLVPFALLVGESDDFDTDKVEYALLIISMGYSMVILGWKICSLHQTSPCCLNNVKILKMVSFSTFGVAITTVFYVLGKGGVAKVLSNGALTRYGYESFEPTAVDFLAHVCSWSEILIYVILSMKLSGAYTTSKKRLNCLYVVALLCYLLLIFSTSSRGALAFLLVMHLIIYMRFRRGVVVPALLSLPVLMLLIVYGKQLFYALASATRGDSFTNAFFELDQIRLEASGGMFERVLMEFRHNIESLIVAIGQADFFEHTYFADFVYSALRIIPQKITREIIDIPPTISTINTMNLHGIDVASTPPGLLGHFYYALGFLGVICGALVYGYFGKRLNNALAFRSKENPVYFPIFCYVAILYGSFVVNGDPNVYFYSCLWPIITYIAISKCKDSHC